MLYTIDSSSLSVSPVSYSLIITTLSCSLGVADLGRSDSLFRRCFEWYPTAIDEHHWLVVFWNAAMHQRAVLVSFHMRMQALVRTAPSHTADFLTWYAPIPVTVERLPEGWHMTRVCKINKCIAKANLSLQIDWKIKEVVQSSKTLRVQQRKDHRCCVFVWQIT